ncbi:MAG TPA: endonuclease/exonuclease/phosphatase family protein [Lentimicrobium sp.]|nr:endonuclease/exonuclease/phosphatase family protein [Lentimicrobium sp.]
MKKLNCLRLCKKLLLVFLVVISMQSCAQGQKLNTTCIAFYNLENMYDTIDDPRIDDADFLPSGNYNWTEARYQAKLSNMAKVISGLGAEFVAGGPSVIGLAEVENRGVLEDLINTPMLRDKGYRIIHYNSPDERGIDVALLYKSNDFKVSNTTSNRLVIPEQKDFHTRDQLVVTGELDGEKISVIVNHWPSRRSEPEYRKEAARLCRHLSDSLMREDKNARILIMGDMNDDPADSSVFDVLGAKGLRENLRKGELFNPMWMIHHNGRGTLTYRDNWNLFDQIIVSQALLSKKAKGWKLDHADICNEKFLFEQEGKYAGNPFRTYAGRKYLGGYSDHLPVFLILNKQN